MNRFVRDNLALSLKGKKILLGITGSIAAFKACEIVRGLKDAGAQVKCVLTDSALQFITATTLETLSEEPVLTSLFEEKASGTHHIATARWADAALIAPATANTIGKLALGLADDLLSTELLAFTGPVCIAPAMNPAMYANAAVMQNVQTLKDRGVRFLGPTSGLTACGEEGLGRMLEPLDILKGLARCFDASGNGKHVLISLGPTQSAYDPVRYLTNRSSGLMGASLAWAATRLGYRVTLVCGPTDADLPNTAVIHRVRTTEEMASRVLETWPHADIFIAAAAVLDWEFAHTATEKLKKTNGPITLELKPTTDILKLVGASKRPGQFILGFAAETEAKSQNLIENALLKLRAKNCDAVFANDVSNSSIGFESSDNAGIWITSSGVEHLEKTPKPVLAQHLLEKVSGACLTPQNHV